MWQRGLGVGSGRLGVIVAVVASCLGIADWAGAERPIRIGPPGNLQLTVNTGAAPKALPKAERLPVAFSFSAGIRMLDGSRPPALSELTLGFDRDLLVDVAGLPICGGAELKQQTLAAIRESCQGAIVGAGVAGFEIASSGGTPHAIPARANLIVVNGGAEGKVTTLYLLDETTVPAPAVVRMPMRVQASSRGPFGSTATVSVPDIAGGLGSIVNLSFTLQERTMDGRENGPVALRCPDGKLVLAVGARFRDGSQVRGTLRRQCIGKARAGA